MRASLGLIGLLLAMGIGYLVYTARIQSGVGEESLPQQRNLTAVRRDLISLGQAERLYLATNGKYGSVEELRQSGVVSVVPEGAHWGYVYSIDLNGSDNFWVHATPIDPGSDLPVLKLDRTMQISE